MYRLKISNKGSALVLVILVMVVLTILGTTVLSIALAETRQVMVQENKMKSYYTARSGADAVASHLIKHQDELDDFINKTKSGPITGSIEGRDFESYVTGTEHEFIIESISYDSNGQEADRVYLTMREFNLLDHAVFANKINMGNNLTINGNIGTNNPSVSFGHNPINGNITLGPNATVSDIAHAEAHITNDHMVNQLPSIIIFPPVNPLDFPDHLPNNTTNINTADHTLEDGKLIRTLNNIDIGGNTEFLARGGGQVHLFITGDITVSGNATIGTDGSTELYLYYNKTNAITYNGGPTSNVTVYAPFATVNFNGGGSSTSRSSFICDTYNGPSSNSVLNQGNGSMQDLVIDGVAGYYRAVWSK